MRLILLNPYFLIFLFSAPLLVLGKELGRIRFKWSIVLLIFCIVGWACTILGIGLYFDMLETVVKNTPNPAQQLIEKLTNDGAIRVFGLLFGWLYSLIYFSICLFAGWGIKTISHFTPRTKPVA